MKSKLGTICMISLLIGAAAFAIWPDFILGWIFARSPRMADALSQSAGNRAPARSEWKTNWDKKSIELDELISGGPPRDGIPPIDDPTFIAIEEAAGWLHEREPVLVYAHQDIVRAYPLQVLTWHEIVNDTVAGRPVSVTYCPLCNAAIVFHRRVGDQLLTFGTSGMLRMSDMVMWDRQTESLWQQLTGEAIVGDLTGAQLEVLPSQLISFGDFSTRFPDGEVLSRNTGHQRDYGANPYVGYDTSSQPFLYDGELDSRLAPMARVVAFTSETQGVAYAYSYLAEHQVVNVTIGDEPVAIFHQPGTTSAMHAKRISQGRDVGAVGVFSRRLDGQVLTFSHEPEAGFRDEQTGSTWSHMGIAEAGPLEGRLLDPVIHFNHFWFAWRAFFPDTQLITKSSDTPSTQ